MFSDDFQSLLSLEYFDNIGIFEIFNNLMLVLCIVIHCQETSFHSYDVLVSAKGKGRRIEKGCECVSLCIFVLPAVMFFFFFSVCFWCSDTQQYFFWCCFLTMFATNNWFILIFNLLMVYSNSYPSPVLLR